MHEGFTLVEMLIVVTILGILMSIVFRLGAISNADKARTQTVVRLQKIENCLSGYYAAFGSYPPVKLHGSRDIYCEVDENGDQDLEAGRNETFDWQQINAACRSQPFGCEYPGDDADNKYIEDWAAELKERANNAAEFPAYAKSDYKTIYDYGFSGPPDNANGFASEAAKNNPTWGAGRNSVKLFKFGVMSFLLPRYLFMMGGPEGYFEFAQWKSNNDMVSNPFTGEKFNSWEEVQELAQTDEEDNDKKNRSDLAKIANIPSQAVCARWMPNLEGVCATLRSMQFFGISVTDADNSGLPLPDDWAPDPGTHFPPTGNTPYKNATVTAYDGWGNEFYYYSPAPYQAYTVWSAGSNRKTFPPWISVDSLNGNDRKTAMDWMADDVRQMSN